MVSRREFLAWSGKTLCNNFAFCRTRSSNIEIDNLQGRYVLHLDLGRHVGAEGESRVLSTAHPLHVTT